MGAKTSGRREKLIAALRRVVLAAAEHRHLAVGAGILLLCGAAWCFVRSDDASTASDDDGLVELDGYDAPAAPFHQSSDAPDALALPPSPTEQPMPLDLGAAFAEAGLGSSEAPVNSAYYVSSPESSPSSPVWLTGTIESADDAPPVFDAAIHYTRPAPR